MSALSAILREAEGRRLIFWCPGCDGAHGVGVGAGDGPRWNWNGSADKPTFSPSILVTYNGADAGQAEEGGRRAPPAVCHSFVTDGQIQFLNDCTHALAGQTVPTPPFEA